MQEGEMKRRELVGIPTRLSPPVLTGEVDLTAVLLRRVGVFPLPPAAPTPEDNDQAVWALEADLAEFGVLLSAQARTGLSVASRADLGRYGRSLMRVIRDLT